jgi:perosamine synthetase
VRGFPDDDLFERLRVRPSPPLLATMQRRLRRLDSESIAARARAGEALAALLAPRLGLPGGGADRRTHWVFPIVAPDPTAFVTALRRAGFDAAGGTTSIGVVSAPRDRPALEPQEAQSLMRDVVFLPAYPELSGRKLRRLAEAANAALAETEAR